jgi:ABC-2 type transport system ATP-binding protein
LQEYNRRTGATILLTSHYMADVTSLCERIIIIHQGQLKYDGGIGDLSRRIAPYKVIGVALGEVRECDLSCYGDLINTDNGDGKQYIRVWARMYLSYGEVSCGPAVHDLTIEDPSIETVIEQAFNDNSLLQMNCNHKRNMLEAGSKTN